MAKKKRKRGAPTKGCPDCGAQVHARASACKECGYVFFKKKNSLVEDFLTLSRGDIIKSVGGHGPYYLNTKDDNQEKMYLGNYGIFKVIGKWDDGEDNRGVLVRKYKKRLGTSGPMELLYMGIPNGRSATGVMIKNPHKLLLVKKAKIEEANV